MEHLFPTQLPTEHIPAISNRLGSTHVLGQGPSGQALPTTLPSPDVSNDTEAPRGRMFVEKDSDCVTLVEGSVHLLGYSHEILRPDPESPPPDHESLPLLKTYVQNGSCDLARNLLLLTGADPATTYIGDETLLEVAIKRCDHEMVSVLLSAGKFKANVILMPSELTHFGLACKISNLKVVRLLHDDNRVNVNTYCLKRLLPLFQALEREDRNLDVASFLFRSKKVRKAKKRGFRWAIGHSNPHAAVAVVNAAVAVVNATAEDDDRPSSQRWRTAAEDNDKQYSRRWITEAEQKGWYPVAGLIRKSLNDDYRSDSACPAFLDEFYRLMWRALPWLPDCM